MGICCGALFVLLGACSGGGSHLKRGDELARSGLHEEALEAYEQAASADPQDPVIQARLAATRKQLASAAVADGLHLLESGDALGALQVFKRALQLLPDDEQAKQNLKKAALVRMAQANKAIEQKRFAEAIELYQGLIAELPRLQQAKQGLKDAQLAWAEVLLEQAGSFQERGLHGNALLDLIRIRQLTGAYGDSAEREAASRGHLTRAATFGFQARPAKVKQALVPGTARLVQGMQRAAVKQCALESEAQAPKVILTVGLDATAFEQTRSESTGKQKYQSGTRPVDNPAFVQLEQQIDQTRRRIAELEQAIQEDLKELEQVRQAFADAGPSDDEAALRGRLKKTEGTLAGHRRELAEKQDLAITLRAKLSKTPRMLDEPVYDTHAYPVFEVTRKAIVRMVFGARSDEGQLLIRAELVEGSAATADKTHRAEPRYGVKADPLAFPKADEDLIDEASDAAVAAAAGRLEDLCKRWQGEILERARQAKSGAELEAIEDYLLYLFVSKEPPPEDLVQFLKEKKQFSEIGPLRGK